MATIRIDDNLLDALADRWAFIEPDFPGQTFEAWLSARMRDYNEFGYLRRGCNGDATLWDLIGDLPPAGFDDYVTRQANEMRAIGGTFAQAVRDLRPLARLALSLS